MKKILIGISMAAVSASVATAGEVVAIFGKAVYPGEIPDRIMFSEIRCGKTYDIEGICSFDVTNLNAKYSTFINNKFLHWYKADCMTVTPEDGIKLSRISFFCVDADHCADLSVSDGDAPSDKSVPATIWSGEMDRPFTLAANAAQLRVSYAVIEYSGTASSGIGDVVHDPDCINAPVEYYNLQGVRVAEPSHGIYIRRQGSDIRKVYITP